MESHITKQISTYQSSQMSTSPSVTAKLSNEDSSSILLWHDFTYIPTHYYPQSFHPIETLQKFCSNCHWKDTSKLESLDSKNIYSTCIWKCRKSISNKIYYLWKPYSLHIILSLSKVTQQNDGMDTIDLSDMSSWKNT